MTTVTTVSERVARRNMLMLIAENVSFGVAMAFLSPATILPGLIRLLGGSPFAVGILGALISGGWLLPQLFASRLVANRPLVKAYVVIPLAISRASLFLLGPALLWLAPRSPGLAVGAILCAYAAFIMADSVASVAWFELLGKTVPGERRARLMGAAQTVTGLLAIGAGVVIKVILGRPGSLLANHVLLVFLAGLSCITNPFLLSHVREPRGVVQGKSQPAWREYLPHLLRILRTDPRFAWLTAMRWLSGLADMAATFYVLFAADRLHLPQETVGLFVSAGVVGGLLSGALLGPLGDRKGSPQVIRVVMVLRVLCPSLALLAPGLAGLHPGLGTGAFLIIYVAMAMANGAWFVGFMNYILEIAPPEQRAMYVGLANTLGGLLLVAPLLAGWLIQVLSYELLFAVVLVLAVLGLLGALRGPRPAPQAEDAG